MPRPTSFRLAPQSEELAYQLHPSETLVGDGGFASHKALIVAQLDKVRP